MSVADVQWEEIAGKLPYERNPDAYAARKALFDELDRRGKGYLSMAEVDKGIRDVLHLDAVFDAKPAIQRAFSAAKRVVPDSGYGVDYIQRREFRIVLEFLRHYFELWVMFRTIDSKEERRVDFEEFLAALPQLATWGVPITKDEAQAVFYSIDNNAAGNVLFAEFCTWAIKHRLDIGEENPGGERKDATLTVIDKVREDFQRLDTKGDGTMRREELSAVLLDLTPDLQEGELDLIWEVADVDKDGLVKYQEFVDWLFNQIPGRGGRDPTAPSIDWEEILQGLPWQRTAKAFAQRQALFDRFDQKRKGYLSLAEVDRGLRDALNLDQAFHATLAIARAFEVAKHAMPDDGLGADCIQRTEFRILLQHLEQNFELWVLFETIDSAEDRRIDLQEFTEALPKLQEWGMETVDIDVDDVFSDLHADHDGDVLFAEFCMWVIGIQLDLGEDGPE